MSIGKGAPRGAGPLLLGRMDERHVDQRPEQHRPRRHPPHIDDPPLGVDPREPLRRHAEIQPN